jgi:membrane-associated protein
LAVIFALAAISGDNVGYMFGKKIGPKIFTRDDSLLFQKKHVERTQKFYEKYGTKTIVLARFIPIVRTFAPILAGVASMNYATFFKYNVIGGLIWGVGISFIGFFLGSRIPGIENYLNYIIVAIIATSFLPIVFEVVKGRIKGKI